MRLNLQYFGGRGSSGGKRSGGGGGSKSISASELNKTLLLNRGALNVSELGSLFSQAEVGSNVTVRIPGGTSGFRTNAMRSYEFRKTSDGTWKEIFGDHSSVSNSTLAEMYYKGKRR